MNYFQIFLTAPDLAQSPPPQAATKLLLLFGLSLFLENRLEDDFILLILTGRAFCGGEFVLTGFAACPTLEVTHIQFMNALKSGHVAILCSLILSGTALYITNQLQADKQAAILNARDAARAAAWQPTAVDKAIEAASTWQPPAKDKIIEYPVSKADKSGDVFDQVAPDATNPNGTPLGAWAATLVRITNAIESDLFKDPATGKLVHLVNGKFFEEKNPYMTLTPQAISYLAKLRLDEQQQQPKVIVQMLPPLQTYQYISPPLQTHDYMNDFYQQQTMYQNQQAIEEMRQLRHDYEFNSVFH